MSGQYLLVSVFPDGSWGLGFAEPNWTLTIGSRFSVQIYFDKFGPFDVSGTARTTSMIFVQFPNSTEIKNAFRNGSVLYVNIADKRFNFALTNTQSLLPTLYSCVAQAMGTASDDGSVDTTPKSKMPPPTAKPNSEIEAARNRMTEQLGKEYSDCIDNEMKTVVPYSTEGAETLAQVVITKCDHIAAKFVETWIVLFELSRSEAERIINTALKKRKKIILADIVSFRAALNKAIINTPSEKPADKKAPETGL